MKKDRRTLRWSLALLVALGVVLFAFDSLSYRFDGFASCGSDHLYLFRHALVEYRQSHDGLFPETLEEVRADVGEYWLCAGSDMPFSYMPTTFDTGTDQIVLMCPIGSHGFIRQFSYGVVLSDEELLSKVVFRRLIQAAA